MATDPLHPPRTGRASKAAGHLAMALACVVLLAPSAWAQMFSVPRNGVAGDWVEKLEIPLESDWEWIETAEDRVFFATRMEATRAGDVVTMWMRVEYRDPQPASRHLSVAEKDEWDCRTRKRSTLATTLYRWNNLQDNNPNRAAAALRVWQTVPKDTIGEALLDFACSIHPTSTLMAPAPAMKGPAAGPTVKKAVPGTSPSQPKK